LESYDNTLKQALEEHEKYNTRTNALAYLSGVTVTQKKKFYNLSTWSKMFLTSVQKCSSSGYNIEIKNRGSKDRNNNSDNIGSNDDNNNSSSGYNIEIKNRGSNDSNNNSDNIGGNDDNNSSSSKRSKQYEN
jgi:hypothetical protein